MARTVAQINTYCRNKTGYEKNSDTDEGFITDASILDSINDALAYMSEEKCFSATGYIQLISGQKEYVLPATFIDFVRNSEILILAGGNAYPVSLITEKEKSIFNGNIPQQTSFTSAPILMSRKENKLVFENITPTSDHVTYQIVIHFYREHEELSASTETPYRINSSSQRIVQDKVISDIYQRDKEYQLAGFHESKFLANVEKYKEKEIMNRVQQSSVLRVSDYGRSVKRAEVYDS